MTAYDGSNQPQIVVEFGARASTAGLFVVGTSTVSSGTDLVATGSPWTTVTADLVRTIDVRRGRTSVEAAVSPGETTLVLDNTDGQFDPDNGTPANPWSYLGKSQITPRMRVRVSAVWSATTYPLFTGRAESVIPDMGYAPLVTLTAVDGLADLASFTIPEVSSDTSDPAVYVGHGDTTATRAGSVLDQAGWTAGRSISGARQMLGTLFGKSAAELIEQAARAEAGRFYVAADGTLTFLPHSDTYSRTVKFTLADDLAAGTIEFDDLKASPGYDTVVNRATVKRDYPGSFDVTSEDGTSISNFGERSLPDFEAPLFSNTDAQGLADYLATRRSRPAPRLDSAGFEALSIGTAWAGLLGCELGDRVAARRTTVDGRMRAWTVALEQIQHTISTDSWRVSIATSPLDVTGLYGTANVFRVGTSTVSGVDVLSPY